MEQPKVADFGVGLIYFLGIFGVVGICLLLTFLITAEGIMLYVGLLFSLSWLIIIPLAKHKRIQKNVRQKGIRLLTKYENVIDESTERLMPGEESSGPFFVRTSWYDLETNTLYYFQSNILSKNPHLHLQHIEGIYVYVDPKNFNHNYMDLSFLPPRFNGL